MLGFSPLAGATLASTGDSGGSVTVSINPSGGIERSANNLSTPMLRAAVGFLPEETLFEVVVNGRILGDITNDGSFNTNDVVNALQWEAGTSSAASTAYIEGPMTDYMLANQAAYEGINIAFSSLEMSGVVGSVTTSEGQGSLVVFSGWSAGAWSSGAWGETNNLTNAISGNVGSTTISIEASASVSGIPALGQVGPAASAINASVVVAGLSASGQVNSVLTTASAFVDVSGVGGTGQEGIIDGLGNAVAYLLGFGPIGSVGGTVAIASADVDVGSLQSSGNVNGVVTTGTATVSPEGVESSGDVSPVSPVANAVVSVQGDLAFGLVRFVTVSASAEHTVSGVDADGEVGDAEIKTSSNLSVSGVGAVGAVGTISIKISISFQVTGLSSQCLQGSVLVWGRIVPENLANWVEVEPVEVDPWTQIPAQSSAVFQPLVPNAGTGYTEIKPDPDTVWEKVAA